MVEKELFNSKNLKTIAVVTIVIAVLALGLSFAQKPKYKSSAKLLVVSAQADIDAYTASQSSNYIAGVLSEVIYSSSFIDNVLQSNFELTDTLGYDLQKRHQNWQKLVRVETKENKGIMAIDVLHPDKNQADLYAKAIIDTLLTKHELYHGAGEAVSIRVIDNPITSEKWAQPKIFQNLILSVLAGIVIGLTIIVLFPNQKLFNKFFNINFKKKNKNTDFINSFNEFSKGRLASEDETNQYFAW